MPQKLNRVIGEAQQDLLFYQAIAPLLTHAYDSAIPEAFISHLDSLGEDVVYDEMRKVMSDSEVFIAMDDKGIAQLARLSDARKAAVSAPSYPNTKLNESRAHFESHGAMLKDHRSGFTAEFPDGSAVHFNTQGELQHDSRECSPVCMSQLLDLVDKIDKALSKQAISASSMEPSF